MRTKTTEDNSPNIRPFIDGSIIYLREVRLSDVDENYYRWLNDREVTRYLEIRYTSWSLEKMRNYVEQMDQDPDNILLAICLKENDRHIGNIKLGPVNWIHRFAYVSLLIGEKSCWGKGIATESIRILSRFAFDVLNLRKLTSGCYGDNKGSTKAFSNAGFVQEGVLKKQRQLDGKLQDEIVFGLCPEDVDKRAL